MVLCARIVRSLNVIVGSEKVGSLKKLRQILGEVGQADGSNLTAYLAVPCLDKVLAIL